MSLAARHRFHFVRSRSGSLRWALHLSSCSQLTQKRQSCRKEAAVPLSPLCACAYPLPAPEVGSRRWDPGGRNSESCFSPTAGHSGLFLRKANPGVHTRFNAISEPSRGKGFPRPEEGTALLSSLRSSASPLSPSPAFPGSRLRGRGRMALPPSRGPLRTFVPTAAPRRERHSLKPGLSLRFGSLRCTEATRDPQGLPPPQRLRLLLAEAALGFPTRFGWCRSPVGRVSPPAPVGDVQPTPSQPLQNSACPVPVPVPSHSSSHPAPGDRGI